jgi:hypothetical protein
MYWYFDHFGKSFLAFERLHMMMVTSMWTLQLKMNNQLVISCFKTTNCDSVQILSLQMHLTHSSVEPIVGKREEEQYLNAKREEEYLDAIVERTKEHHLEVVDTPFMLTLPIDTISFFSTK